MLWKSYTLALQQLTDLSYYHLCKDISALNYNFPIHKYNSSIPSVEHISNVYQRLGITDHYDYIYNVSADSEVLKAILAHNSELQSKTSSIVLADMVHQHAQLFGELGE